jgi:hypothetical protein
MHFMYCLVDSNVVVARHLYHERYAGRIGKRLEISIAVLVNMGILHVTLPTRDDQHLPLLK